MSNANDNENAFKRRIRDGFLEKWGSADFLVASDDTLKKFAEARNSSSAAANRYMVFAAIAAFLYLLRIFEIADNLEVGSFKLGDLPFGPFALTVAGLFLSTVALIRSGDSRSFDRQLRLLCEERHSTGCDLEYSIYPNESAWGAPFSVMANATKLGWTFGLIRFLSLLAINLFLVFLVLTPAATALDFLIFDRLGEDDNFRIVQIGTVLFFLLTNVTTFVLVTWMQVIDRD